MAKKEFNMEKIQEIARSKDISAANHEGPKYIPKVPDQPKKPIQTTIGIYKEDLIALKLIASKKYAQNLAEGIDKKVTMPDIMEEMINHMKEKYQ